MCYREKYPELEAAEDNSCPNSIRKAVRKAAGSVGWQPSNLFMCCREKYPELEAAEDHSCLNSLRTAESSWISGVPVLYCNLFMCYREKYPELEAAEDHSCLSRMRTAVRKAAGSAGCQSSTVICSCVIGRSIQSWRQLKTTAV